MSVLVGIHSTDGVVLAADSAATLGGFEGDTAIDTARKITVIGSTLVLGVAGSAGFNQKVVDALEHDSPVDYASLRPVQAMNRLEQALRPLMDQAMAVLQVARSAHGDLVAGHIMGETLIAVPSTEGPQLVKINAAGTGCLYQELLFATIGEGQRTADPFMLWQKKVVWRDGQPNQSRAALSAVWTVDYVVSRHPGRVGGEPAVSILTQTGPRSRVSTLSPDDISTHRKIIADAEAACSDSFSVLDPSEAAEIPNFGDRVGAQQAEQVG